MTKDAERMRQERDAALRQAEWLDEKLRAKGIQADDLEGERDVARAEADKLRFAARLAGEALECDRGSDCRGVEIPEAELPRERWCRSCLALDALAAAGVR